MLSTTEIENLNSNTDQTVFASAARTTTQTSSDIPNLRCNAAIVTLDTTAAASGSVTLTLQGKDSVSGQYRTLLAGAAVTTVTTNVYKVGPTVAASANAIAQDYLPPYLRVVCTANNANTQTYSVGLALVRV